VLARIGAAHHALGTSPRCPARGAATAEEMKKAFLQTGKQYTVRVANSPQKRLRRRKSARSENDKIVVFGSFLTVGEIICMAEAQDVRYAEAPRPQAAGRRRGAGAARGDRGCDGVRSEPRETTPPVSVRIPGENETRFHPQAEAGPEKKQGE